MLKTPSAQALQDHGVKILPIVIAAMQDHKSPCLITLASKLANGFSPSPKENWGHADRQAGDWLEWLTAPLDKP